MMVMVLRKIVDVWATGSSLALHLKQGCVGFLTLHLQKGCVGVLTLHLRGVLELILGHPLALICHPPCKLLHTSWSWWGTICRGVHCSASDHLKLSYYLSRNSGLLQKVACHWRLHKFTWSNFGSSFWRTLTRLKFRSKGMFEIQNLTSKLEVTVKWCQWTNGTKPSPLHLGWQMSSVSGALGIIWYFCCNRRPKLFRVELLLRLAKGFYV